MSAEQQAAVDSTVALCREEIQSVSGTVTVGRSGYLISEPENAKGEADFVSLVFRSGSCFEVIGILIAGMGFYKTGFLSARLSSRFYLTAVVVGYAITGAVC